MSMRFVNTQRMFDEMVGIVAGKRLVCSRCGTAESLSEERAAEYFRSGWPRCCGQTMTLRSPAKAEEGR